MKANWLRTACAAGLIIAGTALAQSPDITSFHGNGQLTWTNSDTNLFYRVEWSPSLAAPDTWHSSYSSLTDIRSSNPSVTFAVPMFYRVCGSSNRLVYPAPVPKTGQTNEYQSGDDGTYTNGVVWPNPRFTVQADTNCVLDNLTGLIWARNANMGGLKTWSAAITYCDGLEYGGTNDWRLPNEREVKSLTHSGYDTPSLCSTAGTGHWTENDPFRGVVPDAYWSSSTYEPVATRAWYVSLADGHVYYASKTITFSVWPVRGGQ